MAALEITFTARFTLSSVQVLFRGELAFLKGCNSLLPKVWSNNLMSLRSQMRESPVLECPILLQKMAVDIPSSCSIISLLRKHWRRLQGLSMSRKPETLLEFLDAAPTLSKDQRRPFMRYFEQIPASRKKFYHLAPKPTL